ncbi:MAG: GNAT family N-acetyltransferase [Lentisphaeria bacterium]
MNSDPQNIIITSANINDAKMISEMLTPYVKLKIVLPRTPEDILSHLNNFLTARIKTADGKSSHLIGAVALRNFGPELQEIRSLIVSPDYTKHGLGTRLIQAAINLAKERHCKNIFALTLRPNLFTRIGFEIVPKEQFPQKVWADCSKCPKQDCCDEIAVKLPFSS